MLATDHLCDRCVADLAEETRPRCLTCHRPLDNAVCPDCVDGRWPVFAVARYRGSLAETIVQLKFHHVRTAIPDLIDRWWKLHQESLRQTEIDALIPVPLHRSRYHARGFNQASFIAERLAKQLRLPVREDVVVRHRRTRSQSRLPQSERKRNVASSFDLAAKDLDLRVARTDAEELSSWRVAIVDDVVTTGATAHAVADVLESRGAEVVAVFALASALGEA